jgi:mxaJ protein
MCSPSRSLVVLVLLVTAGCDRAAPPAPAAAADAGRELRVCADPNNLPFSNQQEEGFENRLAELIARDMGATVRYTWWAQRRGFVRNTVRAGSCDVVMGVPSEYELLAVTTPYYRSTYVFLSRADARIAVRSLADPELRRLRIGVHVIGDDYANPPPAHALARRQIVSNVVGYSIFGDYRQPNPPARLVEAVAAGDVQLAILWGPHAGYFAQRQPVAMAVTPVPADTQMPDLPFAFDIAMGVTRDRPELLQELNAILARRRPDIRQLLDDFGIPVVPVQAVGR